MGRLAAMSQNNVTLSIAHRGQHQDQNRTMTSFGDLSTSPGHFALFEAIRFKRHRQVLLLTEAGVDVNCRNGRGLTPLIHAVVNVEDERSLSKLVRMLLEAGANPNLLDWDGFSALMLASLYGYADVVKILLENEGTKVGIRDPDGNTAFMLAAAAGHANVISTFLAKFREDMATLRLNTENCQGMTALQLASSSGNEECARILTREAQIFPKAISSFPDPRILEREPTPMGMTAPIRGKPNDLSHIDDFIASSDFSSPTKDIGINAVLAELPDTAEKSPNSSYSDDFESIPEERVYGTPPDDRDEVPPKLIEYRNKTVSNRSTQTPAKWLQSYKPRKSKILDPITNFDSVAKHHSRYRQTDKEPAEKQKFPSPLTFSRPSTDYMSAMREQTAKNGDQKRLFWHPVGMKPDNKNGRRPETEPSMLPVIPCASPLPPVGKSLLASDLKKCSLQMNSSFYMSDKHCRESNFMKNNVTVNSS